MEQLKLNELFERYPFIKKKWVAEQAGITDFDMSQYINGRYVMPKSIKRKITAALKRLSSNIQNVEII